MNVLSPYIKKLFAAGLLMIAPVFGFGQVLVWQGQSQNWNDLSNWVRPSGQAAENLPGENTHVIFPAVTAGTIFFQDESIAVSSITANGTEPISFESNQATRLMVGSGLNLGENASFAPNVSIELAPGIELEKTVSIPPLLTGNMNGQGDGGTDMPSGIDGACPFFDIVPDPTPPTCNGFDDGIAAVLEPTTGVGPYTYQWIGGPDTREYPNVGAGTYTVIVIDLGQGGLPCNVDVFVNEPGPLSLFALNGTAPTCADVCNGQAAPIVIGGNGGYTLDWSSGETGLAPSMLCSTFALDIEDSEGCTADTTVTFNNLPDPILIDEAVTGITCFGNDDGQVDITLSGGTGNLSPSWSGPNGFTLGSEDISGLEPGDYTIEVTDDNGCTVDETYTIVENPVIVISSTVDDNECNGDNTGGIDLDVSGGLPPYDFSWTGPAGFTSVNEDISGLLAGTYEVTVTDAANCVTVSQETVNEPTPLSALIVTSNLFCFEDNTGEINAQAQGGTPGYNYSWDGPNGFFASGPTIIALVSGTYTLTVTDANDCEYIEAVDLIEPDELVLTFVETPISCNGDSDGEIDLTIVGGTAPYIILWSGPSGFSSGNEDIAGLLTGTYTVEVTDFNDCVIFDSYDLSEPEVIDLSAQITNAECATGNSGAIDLTVANGSLPYNFDWSGPNGFSSADEDISNLEAGTYTVQVTDGGGCTESDSYAISAPSDLNASFGVTQISCFGGTNGAIAVTPSGGTPPYTFLWLGPNGFISPNQNISDLAAGEYSLLLSDGNDCDGFFLVTVNEPSDISVSNTIGDVTCFGGSDGSINITPSGAVPPYSFQWSGPLGFSAAGQNISGLIAGDYTVEITDSNDCIFERIYTVDEPDEITIPADITDVVCAGDASGEIDVTISGGNPGYNYSWTGPGGVSTVTEDLTGLLPGLYTIQVTDAEGCTASEPFTIGILFDISLMATGTNISCFGQTDGAVNLTASGGLEPYTFNWAGPNGFTSADEDLSGLEAGQYTITVFDANGCEASALVDIIEPAEIEIDLVATDIDCFGDNDGAIVLTTTGGTAPLDFSWTGPGGFTSANQNLNNLVPGDYQVVVEDANGCTSDDLVTITESPELIVTVEAFDSNCQQSDGLAVGTAAGGTSGLTFIWEDSDGIEVVQNDSLIDVPSGTYTLTVIDDLGCSVEEIAVISDSDGTITGAIVNPTCAFGNDGSIDATLTGGTDPLTYEWSDGTSVISDQEDIQDLEAGMYIISITDSNGCLYTETFEVIDPDEIEATPTLTEVSCAGADGAIDLAVVNAAEPFTVSWTGPDGFMANGTSLNMLLPGNYDFTIEDDLGCAMIGSISLTSALSIAVDETLTDISCAGADDGSIELEVSGGVSPIDYAWSGPDGFVSADENIFGLAPGEYALSVSDQSDCGESLTFTISEPDAISVVLNITESDCNASNGSIEAVISGGTVAGGYSIVWEDDQATQISTSELVENLSTGIYGLTITDDNGCVYQESVAVTNPGGDITPTVIAETCAGEMDGSITLDILNVAEPYAVSWTGPAGYTSIDEDISNLAGGSYTYEVSGSDGCVFTEILEVPSTEAIQVAEEILGTCFGESEGSIAIEISGGTEPFTIGWSGPNGFSSNELSLANLEAGDYTLSVTDGGSCSFTETYTVFESPEILVDILSVGISCFGEADGSIDLDLSGGSDPLSVQWQGPDGFVSNDEDIADLEGGEYILVVTDLNGCSVEETVTIEEPAELIVIIEVTASGCDSEPNSGSISLFPEGGQPGYLVDWNGPDGFTSGSFDLSSLEPGVYSYAVTDVAACTASGDIEIVAVEPLEVTAGIVEPNCFGEFTGTLEPLASGGLAPYGFSWNGPNGYTAGTDTIENLEAGTYTVQVTDSAGCNVTESFELDEPDELEITLNSSAATCENGSDGTGEATVSGGTPDYIFEWSDSEVVISNTEIIAELAPGEYFLTVTDANDCTIEDSLEIDVLFDLNVNAGEDFGRCPSDLPLTVNGDLDGGDLFYWTLDGDTISSSAELEITDSLEGAVEIILLGSNGECSESDTLMVEIFESPQVDAGEDLQVFVEEVFTIGGSPTSADEVSYSWAPNPTAVFDTTTANPTGFLVQSQEFVVTVSDLNGCESTDTVFVEVLPEFGVTSGFTPNGDGVNDTWIIDNIELFPNMAVHVFNRWGVEVFESQGYNANIAWDGTYEGSFLPSGTYYYTVELNDSRFPDPFTGPVTLHR